MDAVLNVAVSNSLLAGALALVALVVHRWGRNPQLAHALWLLVLIKLITPPLVSIDLPVLTGSFAAASPLPTESSAPERAAVSDFTADETSAAAITIDRLQHSATSVSDDSLRPTNASQQPAPPGSATSVAVASSINWLVWFCTVWAAGIVAGTAVLLRQLRRFQRLLAGADAADPGLTDNVRTCADQLEIRRLPRVRVLDAQLPPLVYAGGGGLTLLLPARLLRELDAQQIQTVLVHELAHIRRRDHWTRWFDGLLRIVLWWHPLVWFAGSQLRRAQEECCDAWVIWALPDQRRAYGNALLWTVEYLSARAIALPVVGTGFGGSSVRSRIESIMHRNLRRRMSLGALLALIVLAACVLPVAAQQRPGDPSDPEAAVPAAPAAVTSPAEPPAGPRIEVAAGASIQAAIDAAPAGATIVVAPGTFAERIRITKPLTIAGAGWDQTTLQPASGGEHPDDATLTIRGAQGVNVRGIRITVSQADAQAGTRTVGQGGLPNTTAVRLTEADAVFADVVVVGPCGVGIDVAGGSQLEMSGSLVAAIWDTGIAVHHRDDAGRTNTLKMRDCVVRNCYHRCVTLGAGSDASVIERCWISGSAWHGILVGDASPRIEHNIISGNARFGIYASGKTASSVKRNLFAKNEMAGMCCLSANADTIEANIFTANAREALGVCGASTPRIANNLFDGEKIGVRCGKILGINSPPTAEPQLEANVFRGVESLVEVDGEPRTIPLGNMHIGAGIDFGRPLSEFGPLDTDTAAATYRQAGGLNSLCISPRWPQPLPEELAIIPAGESRDWRAWNKGDSEPGDTAAANPQAAQKADDAIQPWIDDAFQIDDVARREAAIEKIRTAISSSSAYEQYLGTKAFVAIAAVRFDKAAFHDLFVPLLTAENPMLRLQGAQSLVIAGVQEGDVERLAALAGDRNNELRKNIASAIVQAAKSDLTTGPAADGLLTLLNDSLDDVRRETLRALWGARFSTAIEARVLELSRQPGGGYDALYFALSTQPTKSEASVKRLIEFLSDKDTHNVAGRAAWGLGYGVAPAQQPLVGDAMLKVVTARGEGYLFSEAMQRVQQYAGPGQVASIEAVLAKPGVDGDLRTGLEQALAAARSR